MTSDLTLIRLVSGRYENRSISLRTDANGWTDVPGIHEEGVWSFTLDDPPGRADLRFKFVLDGHVWMDGGDLTIRPEAGGTYVFGDADVHFGIDIVFETSAYASGSHTVSFRAWEDGEKQAVGAYFDDAWRFHIDGPFGQGLLRFAFVLDDQSVMEGPPLVVRPEPGGVYVYSETDVRFAVEVRFVTTRYAERLVTVRTSADDWNDVYGRYAEGAWIFRLDAARHPPGTSFKFVLDGDTWMAGSNLALDTTVDGRTEFDDGPVQFSPQGIARAELTGPTLGDVALAPAAALIDTPGVTITAPAAAVVAGYPFVIRGTCTRVGAFSDGHAAQVTGVTVVVDTVKTAIGEVSDTGGEWSAPITMYTVGARDVRVDADWVISYSDGRIELGTATASRPVEVAEPTPTVDASGAALRTGNSVYPIAVRVVSAVPLESVNVLIGAAGQAIPLSQNGQFWSTSVTLPVPKPVPVAGVVLDVSVVARTAIGVGSAQWAVTVVDLSAPTAIWTTPQDDARVVVLSPGEDSAVVAVGVDVTDTAGGGPVVSAGVLAGDVTCTVDGGAATALTAVRGVDPVHWQGLVGVDGLGTHELLLRCQDQAGNATTETRTIVVTRTAARDVTRRGYLADLVDFVASWLAVALAGRRVAPADLTAALSQPFDDLVAGAGRAGERPINAVRGRIEVLRQHLMGVPRAPAAHWPLGEGTGTVVRDDTGGGTHGRLHGGTWGPGRTGGSALVLNGVNDFVDMGMAPQIAIDSAVTLTAWIRPAAPVPAEGGVIAGRESFMVARLPNGTIRWSLDTPVPGWGWVDTDAVAPEGRWTHVAVRYDGVHVRVYVDGALVSEIDASGPISAGAGGGFRIGAQQGIADQFFAGSISDLRVYGVALTSYELRRVLGGDDRADQVWLDDDLPPGAVDDGGEGWTWTEADPEPRSGSRAHRSTDAAGVHRHGVSGVTPGGSSSPGTGFSDGCSWIRAGRRDRSCSSGKTRTTVRGATERLGVRTHRSRTVCRLPYESDRCRRRAAGRGWRFQPPRSGSSAVSWWVWPSCSSTARPGGT